jgi:hypothetical protein
VIPVHPGKHPPRPPSSQTSVPATRPSPHEVKHEEPLGVYPGKQEHTEGAVGLPAVQEKLVVVPPHPARHPGETPASQTSDPATKPSPQFVKQEEPLSEYPGLHVQTEAVDVLPGVQVKLGVTPPHPETHPGKMPASQVSDPPTSPSPH